MSQILPSHTPSGPRGAPIRITGRTRGNESLFDHLNRSAVFPVRMKPHRGLAISSDRASNNISGCGRTVGNNRAVGPCLPGIPSRIGNRANAPESRGHHPILSGRVDKSLRPRWLRVQPRHAPRPVLTRIRAGSCFTMRQIPCVTRWFAGASMTGITKNRNTRHANRDVQ